jgi:peptidoglycan/LPS O-acetylase OafA/YrhL
LTCDEEGMSQPHLKPLTALRFFAAAAIVLFHMKDILPWARPPALSQGVSFFFVLSGFILAYNYSGRLNTREFYINRVARLWPVHLSCLVLVIALIKVPATHFPIWVTVANIFMVQSWFPLIGVPFSFNGPSWSISTEIAFYLCFPFILRAKPFWLTYLLLATAVIGAVFYMGTTEWPAPTLFAPFLPHAILQHPGVRILEFATGVAAARFFSAHPDIRTGTGAEAACLGLLVVFWLFGHEVAKSITNPAMQMWVKESGGMFLFAVTIIAFAHQQGRISRVLSCPWLVLLGEISFCTYMLHQIIIKWYLAQNLEWHWIASATFVITVSYIGSWLMWRYIEKPARLAIVSRLGRSRPTKPLVE